MYPYPVEVLGVRLSIWNAMLLLGIAAGHPMLRATMRRRLGGEALPRLTLLRWLATAYVSALGAQLFAYLFDLGTSALPPPSVSAARYYLDPLYAAKTLYGAILFLPVAALAISVPWGDLRYDAALDAWTPPMLLVLGVARIGCFLQGCCYGVHSPAFGLRFPPTGSLYLEQVHAGLIQRGEWTLPVLPAQLLEGVALLGLAGVSFAAVGRGRTGIFLPAVAAYSVVRFALEMVRADPVRNALGPLSTSQWIAAGILLGYGAHLVAWRARA